MIPVLSVRWLSRLNMAAVGYAERERIRQEQGERLIQSLSTKHTNTPPHAALTLVYSLPDKA